MSEPVLELRFDAVIIEWRGPAPFFYAPIPDANIEEVRHAARIATYGWGAVPVEAEIGGVAFQTSLFPKDGGYLLPIKTKVRQAANVTVGDKVTVAMSIASRDGRHVSR